MRPILLSLLAIATCTTAFTPIRLQTVNPVSDNVAFKQPSSFLRMADAIVETEKPPALPKPALMDDGIFTFNKILIDTVYNIICFFYPVTGGKRDFARFYVLETVARVPYFAYLSVMHLR